MKMLLEELKDFESLYTFTADGIASHLAESVPDPERINGALLALGVSLTRIIDAAEKQLQEKE